MNLRQKVLTAVLFTLAPLSLTIPFFIDNPQEVPQPRPSLSVSLLPSKGDPNNISPEVTCS